MPVSVSWEQSSQRDKCDFCSGPLCGVVPVLDFAVIGGFLGDTLVMGGQWAACHRCQELMGIDPGTQTVDLERVRRRYQEEVDRFFGRAGRRELRHLFRSDVYGNG